MERRSDQHGTLRWWHALPPIVIGVLVVLLWRPAPDLPPSLEQESKIADLAVKLGALSSTATDIDARLRSFGPFPPDATASRSLAESLIACGTTWLDESKRKQLARHLYGITVIGDDRAEAIPAALIGIQESVSGAGPACGPGVVDRIVRNARAVATVDPNPRRNWW